MKKIVALFLSMILVYSFAYAQPELKGLSNEEKVYGLSKFWSEVKYNFIYFDKLTFDWDSLYRVSIPKVLITKDTYEYYNVLREMCARLKDGHTNVYFPSAFFNMYAARPQFRTRLIQDKLIITEIRNDSLHQLGLDVGQEVLKINGTDVKIYAQRYIAPYVSASTKQDSLLRVYSYELFMGKIDETIRLTLKGNNKVFEAIVPRNQTRQKELPVLDLKVLEGNIGLLSLNDFSKNNFEEKFDSLYAKILATDGLIIDVRENGGGNSDQGYYVLQHLTNKPFYVSSWSTRDYRPTYRAWRYPEGVYGQQAGKRGPVDKQLYSKPVVVLISERTYSAAEDFAVAFDYMQRGKLVGTATGGSTGQPLFSDLSGGGSFRICTKKDTYPDGKEFVGVGVQPNISVYETIQSIREKRDIVLENALGLLRDK